LRRFASGKGSLKALMEGGADLATAGDIPIMLAIMEDYNIRILATIESTKENNVIVARKDLGISSPQDLAHKKIGVTLGTGGEFFLDSFLFFHGLRREQCQFVDIKPSEMVEALLSGRIEAASTWNPQASTLLDKLQDNGLPFYGREIYTASQNIVAQRAFVDSNRESIKSILQALIQASDFISDNPVEAQEIVAEALGTKAEQLKPLWSIYNFATRLDQGLVLTLRDEGRWAINNKLVTKTVAPDFHTFISTEILREINPLAVTVNQ
jgi:NitT/TauT family transport system substrate-binding protein